MDNSHGTVVRPTRRAPAFRTSSGETVVLKAGQSVSLNDSHQLVDFVVVGDTTGSMRDKIDGLIGCMVDFVQELGGMQLDWRFSAVPFGDLTVPGDRIDGDLPFVNTVAAATEMIRGLPRFNGGGNNGESSLEAMRAGMAKPFRQRAVKVIIGFTDEPPLVSRQLSPSDITAALTRGEFVCFMASPPQCGYEPWAELNAGKWYPISATLDTSALLKFLRTMLSDIARTSQAVHQIGGGSVARYQALTRGKP